MQNLESIVETSKKTQKTKQQIKKDLKDSIINGKRNENKGIEEKGSKMKNVRMLHQ